MLTRYQVISDFIFVDKFVGYERETDIIASKDDILEVTIPKKYDGITINISNGKVLENWSFEFLGYLIASQHVKQITS